MISTQGLSLPSLGAALASIGDGMIVTDTEGRVTFINSAAQALTGWSQENIAGRQLAEVFHTVNEMSRTAEKPVATLKDAVASFANRTLLLARDGHEIPIEGSSAPLKDEAGQTVGVVVIFRDLKERRQTEVERRLAVQYAVARVLAEANSLHEAYPKVLQALCEGVGWQVGALWRVDEDANRLSYESMWHVPDLDTAEFEQANREHSFCSDADWLGRVWSAGQPAWLADAATTPDFLRSEVVGRTGLHAILTFPIISEGRVAGIIECLSDKIQEPQADMLELLGATGHQIGNFMARMQARAGLETRARQQGVVAELGQLALAGVSLAELMEEIVVQAARTLNVEFTKILELMPGESLLRLQAGVGWREGLVGQATVEASQNSHAGYTLLSREPIIVEELATETRFVGMPLLHEHGVVSGVSVIIHGQERPFGILTAHATRRRKFSRDDVNFLQALANVLAMAVERKRTEEALQLSRDQLAVILAGVADGITAQDRSGRLVYANDAAARLVGYPSAQVLLETPAAEVMQRFRLFDEQGQPLPVEQLPGRQALQGQPGSSAAIRFQVVATGEERWSIVKARPIFNERGQVELAVNIFQEVTELKRTEQNQRLLAELGQLLAASFTDASRLGDLAQLTVPVLADWCAIYVIDDDGAARRLALAHYDPAHASLAETLQQSHSDEPDLNTRLGVANVLRTGRPELYSDLPEAVLQDNTVDPEHLELLHRAGLRSAMIVPMLARRRTLGAIAFFRAGSGRRYSTEDLALGEEIGHRVALALDSARLFSEAQAEINVRRQVEEQLKASLHEKEVLLKEVHHRVKNNLQAISNLLYLQSAYIRDREVVEMFRETQDRVKSIALVHEKLYRSEDLGQIDFAEYIRNLAKHLITSYRTEPAGIRLDVDAEDVVLNIDTAIPVGIVINELVSNALKHAFPGNRPGEIRIALKPGNDSTLTLVVSDNGVGFPEGLGLVSTDSLGLQLVNQLVGHLKGTIELEQPGGTTFRITLTPLEGDYGPIEEG